jgi:hypothetical protein
MGEGTLWHRLSALVTPAGLDLPGKRGPYGVLYSREMRAFSILLLPFGLLIQSKPSSSE